MGWQRVRRDWATQQQRSAVPTGDQEPLPGSFYGRDSVLLGHKDAKVGGLCHRCCGPAEEAEDQ